MTLELILYGLTGFCVLLMFAGFAVASGSSDDFIMEQIRIQQEEEKNRKLGSKED